MTDISPKTSRTHRSQDPDLAVLAATPDLGDALENHK